MHKNRDVSEFDMKSYAIIIDRIKEVFPRIEPPDSVVGFSKRYPDYEEIQTVFTGMPWWEFNCNLVKDNFDKLSLLTSEAFHYYLPAYLLCALEDFDPFSTVLEFTIYSLMPDDSNDAQFLKTRARHFTVDQKKVLIQFLLFVIEDERMELHDADAESALAFWNDDLDN